MHDCHGDIVRVAPDELSFTNAAAWKDIHKPGFLRPYEYRDKPPGKDAENLISANEEDHQRFRKVLAPAFVVRFEQEAIVQRYVNLLIRKLASTIESEEAKGSAIVDVLEWFNYTTFDIIGDVLWGSSFDCLEKVRYHPWIEVIAQFKKVLIVAATKFYYPLDKILMAITPMSAMADLMQIWNTTEEKIRQRIEVGSEQRDMISYMSYTHGSSSPPSKSTHQMSKSEMETIAMSIVVAGSESVTTVLTGIVHYLLRDPTRLGVLVQEIRSAFDQEKEIDSASLSQLPYLGAVLHEGLRLCPTIPDGMRRVVPKGAAMIAGEFLPENTVVSIPQWSAYLSKDNFASPTAFLPERWLDSSRDSMYGTDRRDAFQPFSLGPHNCPGRSIAYLEMRLIMAKLLWNFDLEQRPGVHQSQWREQKIYWFWEKKATYARISRAER